MYMLNAYIPTRTVSSSFELHLYARKLLTTNFYVCTHSCISWTNRLHAYVIRALQLAWHCNLILIHLNQFQVITFKRCR